MPTARLTKRVVDALAPGPKPIYVYDTDLRGFAVRIMPSGFKSWLVEYRPVGSGRRDSPKRVTLGRVGILTPDQARRRAKDELARVRLGANPAAERKAKREAPTVAQMLERFLVEEIRPPKRKASTASLYRHYALNIIGPEIGSLRADALTK